MATTTDTLPTAAAVQEALDAVRDPELDQAITELDFVASVVVESRTARVRLRLPTYFCAPNFAWLMVADARRAIATVPGVATVDVQLDDHYASDEINAGVAADTGFGGSFPGLTDGGLDELRATFRRKAFLSRQHRLLVTLRAQGIDGPALCALRVGSLPAGPETAVYLQRRAELGLPVGPDAALVIDFSGRPMTPDELDDHLARIRTVSVSIEGNAGLCRGLLRTRYGDTAPAPATEPKEPA